VLSNFAAATRQRAEEALGMARASMLSFPVHPRFSCREIYAGFYGAGLRCSCVTTTALATVGGGVGRKASGRAAARREETLMAILGPSLRRIAPAAGVLALLLAAGARAHPAHARTYTVELLSGYGADRDCAPTAINSAGLVTCLAYFPATNATHTFLWNNGAVTYLNPFGSGSSRALGINRSAQVVGAASSENSRARAFRWADGMMQDLGTLGGGHSVANGINAAGQAAGSSTLPGDRVWHAFRWSEGGMQDLGTLGGGSSWAYAISDRGQVVGYSATAGDRALHAFLCSDGIMQDLGTLGGSRSVALGINGVGQVVGWSDATRDREIRAFLWADGVMRDLGTLGGSRSFALGINDAGAVVGSSTTAGVQRPHAFLHTDRTGMVDLNSRIDPRAGWELLEATAINARGQIVGIGRYRGERRAFRLSP
jgi:probable HAF family extracellular repeat protein